MACLPMAEVGELDGGFGEPPLVDAGFDAGFADAGNPDAGGLDAGAPDSGVPDSGVPDSGAPDAGRPDAGSDAGTPSCWDSGADRATQVCQRWSCERADLSEGTWSGSVSTCTAGDMTPEARARALKILNLYRFLAQLPEVTTDPTRDRKSQECALMQSANSGLSHNPPTSWSCYTADGAEASGRSNLSSGPAVHSTDLYMVDPGNATTIGHRRWILSNQLGPVGIGSASKSCLWVIGGSGSGNKPWMSWPPPGPVPIGAIHVPGSGSVDTTGWTVQSNSINLSGAQVTVTEDGQPRPVTVTQLQGGYGSSYAFRFNPSGWSTQAGKSYTVSVTGISTPITYTVEVLACP